MDEVDAADEAEELAELEEAQGPRRVRYRLETARAVRKHLIGLYSDVKAGRLEPLQANRMAKLLDGIAKVNAALDTDRRLERLEQHIEGQRRSTRR
jgi:hypothetical protein